MSKPVVKIVGLNLSEMEMAGKAMKVIKEELGGKVCGKYLVDVLRVNGREAVLKVINKYCEIE